ncbi:MAG TPA: hypothetical protein VN622_03515 [Clostridia bacterium]|nr:hypothetical protein [Clostridia bacterium]
MTTTPVEPPNNIQRQRFATRLWESKYCKWTTEPVLQWLVHSIFGTVSSAVAAKMHKPLPFVLGSFVVVFVVLAAASIVLHRVVMDARKPPSKHGRWALVIPVFCLLVVWWFYRVPTNPPFRAYLSGNPQVAKQLGSPVAAPVRHASAVIAVHEHAVALWMMGVNVLYLLPTDGAGENFKEIADPVWTDDKRHYEDSWLRTKFPECSDKLPPWGGIASHWLSRSQDLEWIGCRKWQCTYKDSSIISQRFEHGMMVGTVHISPKHSKVGNVYVLFDDHSWKTQGQEISLPECKQ